MAGREVVRGDGEIGGNVLRMGKSPRGECLGDGREVDGRRGGEVGGKGGGQGGKVLAETGKK